MVGNARRRNGVTIAASIAIAARTGYSCVPVTGDDAADGTAEAEPDAQL